MIQIVLGSQRLRSRDHVRRLAVACSPFDASRILAGMSPHLLPAPLPVEYLHPSSNGDASPTSRIFLSSSSQGLPIRSPGGTNTAETKSVAIPLVEALPLGLVIAVVSYQLPQAYDPVPKLGSSHVLPHDRRVDLHGHEAFARYEG